MYYVAAASGIFRHEGKNHHIREGRTVAEEGSKVLEAYPQLFRPMEVTYKADSSLDTPKTTPGPKESKAPKEEEVEAPEGELPEGEAPEEAKAMKVEKPYKAKGPKKK